MIKNTFFERLLSNRFALNILFWLVYAGIPFSMNIGRFGSKANMYTDIQFYVECFFLGYFNNLILMPFLFDRKKYLIYFILLITLVIGYNFISTEISLLISPTLTNSDLITVYSVIDFFTFIVAFSAARFVRQHIEQIKKINILEGERLQTEINFLKSQINPHLLFNTLNTLYSYTLENSKKAPSMILKLSEIMRYMLYETNEKEVELKKEIAYIENYIDLQQLRIEGRGHVSFKMTGNPEGLLIAPILLISFVENAFKYSMDSLTENIQINISLAINQSEISFQVENNYEEVDIQHKKEGGLGIKNTQKRLQLLYPENHTLTIDSNKNIFSVKLAIKLHHD